MSTLTLGLFAVSQVGTPGPANMALLATGARFGFRAVLPFVAGVALGKQLIIWPLGYGLLTLADTAPVVFLVFKYAAAAYIIWLAWRVANMRLRTGDTAARAPGFVAGLIVHPLNPKAWAMVTTALTSFTAAGASVFHATATVAVVLLATQILLHPLWAFAGDRIAQTLAGHPGERYLFWTLAALTVASVLYALSIGGAA